LDGTDLGNEGAVYLLAAAKYHRLTRLTF